VIIRFLFAVLLYPAFKLISFNKLVYK
jgi:hypothetical protein